jgi:SAM-dependent methyltransferase
MPEDATGLAAPLDLERLLGEDDVPGCCAAVYEHPGVRWLLGGELHPGGKELSRRAFALTGLGAGDRLLDVGSGDGTTVLLAAAEHGCDAVGLEYGSGAAAGARRRAEELGLAGRVEFVAGDAGSLPFADRSFDVALSECALCTFADKGGAVAEIGRVLRPGGRVAISDVVAEVDRLPEELRGALGAVACVGDALLPGAHRELLEGAGFEVLGEEDRSVDAVAIADRIVDRLRGVKVLGLDHLVPGEGGARAAAELAAEARAAIVDGRIGYTLLTAARADGGAAP